MEAITDIMKGRLRQKHCLFSYTEFVKNNKAFWQSI